VVGWYKLSPDTNYPSPGVGMPIDFTAPHQPVYAKDSASKTVVLDSAIEGHVLVKNVNNILPLKRPRMLSIFGYDAPAPSVMNVPNTNTANIRSNG
jgi:beta-glucosidase